MYVSIINENRIHEREENTMKRILTNKKRLTATMAAAAVLASAAVFAANDGALEVNGKKIDSPKPFTTEEKVTYVPVRAMCEALGMNVDWDNDSQKVIIEKLPVYITFSPGKDGYTFAKTAPMQLGSAPILEDGTTYVPVNFIDEILDAEYAVGADGSVSVKYGTDDADVAVIADVTEINKDEKYTSLTVNDRSRGEDVVVNVTDETKISDEDGKELGFDAIQKGSVLKIVYSDVMTMSLPPMTNAVSIVVMNAENVEKSVTVEEINTDKGEEAITVVDSGSGRKLVLTVAEDTEIQDLNGNKLGLGDIKVGDRLYVKHSEAMTKSIPPITNAIKITVAASQKQAIVVE